MGGMLCLREKLGVAQMAFLKVLRTSMGLEKWTMRECEVDLAEGRGEFVIELKRMLAALWRNM